MKTSEIAECASSITTAQESMHVKGGGLATLHDEESIDNILHALYGVFRQSEFPNGTD